MINILNYLIRSNRFGNDFDALIAETMEAVKAFNNELASLYESKPPVSRAKMAGITKGAIKAVKFYKHVVQSVEKFILKCRAEYKVPGLYVIDSIVRQSRHHFGAEKDVFAQRFSKNIVSTFQNLCSCPPEERSKIVRVLHLWQKNSVFSSEVIQQLLKMVEQEESLSPAAELFDESQNSQHSGASDEIVGTELLSTSDEQRNSRPADEAKSTATSVVGHFGSNEDKVSSGSRCSVESDPAAGLDVQTNVLSSVIQLLQSHQPSSQLLHQQILQQLPQQLLQSGSLSLPQQLLQQLSSASEPQYQQQHPTPASLSFAAAPFSSIVPSSVPLPPAPSPLSQQINAQQRQPEQPSLPLSESQSSLTHLYDRRSEENSQGSEPRFNKNLLEFDYGESDEDDNRQIRPRTEEIIRPPTPPEDDPQGHPNFQFHAMDPSAFFTTREMEAVPPGHQLQHQQQQHLDQQPPLPLLHSLGPLLPDRPLLPPGETMERHDYFRHGSREMDWQNEDDNDSYRRSYRGGFDARQSSGWRELDTSSYENADQMVEQRHQQDYEENQSRDRSRHRDHDNRKSRRSRDRSPRQQRGHSRGDRESSRRSRSRDRRRRSRSRDRSRRSRSRSQDRIREREKRERERERRNRGLPPIEEQHISVCSTTLWIGHLSKHTKENELREELSNYGEITSFNLIPPRGCSYVSFGSRREASRALEKLRGSKLLGNVLKVAWAMGVGMKESGFKDSWDVGRGVSYIPWDRIPVDLDALAEGGFIDEDTLPETVKIARREKLKEMERQSAVVSEPESEAHGSTNVVQASIEANTPNAQPPPLPALPPGIIPPLLPPPPGFVPPMMVPGSVPGMMRLPPPMMHGLMPPGMAAPPPPSSRPALPAATSAMESVSAGEPSNSSMVMGHRSVASEGLPPIPPPDPPGMGFGWQPHLNMRPGMMPFRPPLPPFIPPGPFGHRMPFPSPLPPQFQGSGDRKANTEKPEDEPMELAEGEKAEDKEERLESSIPLPPGAPPPHLPPWPSMGVNRSPNGPRPEFMGGRPRALFGPRGGFPAPLLPLPPGGGRLRRSDEEELEDGIGGRDDELNEDADVDEPAFPGLTGPEGGPGFHPRSLAGPMRVGRPPWFDFRDGPRGPPGPRGMRIPGPPRFPFDERGMGIGRPPPFRVRGPPSLMGDDQRFGVPSSMGLRGRPSFPPRRPPGMQNFRGRPPMDQSFGRPRFGDRGPRPLFPRGFGRPSANDGMECYDEGLEGNQTDMIKDWNEGQEEEDEEEENQWQGNAGDHLGEVDSWRQEQRGGERGRWEGAEVNWSRGGRREDDREGGRWTDRGRRGVEEEGDERRPRSHYKRDEDTRFWADRDGGQCDRGVETADRGRPRSAWGESSFEAGGSIGDGAAGLQEAKADSPVTAKSEKRPRKTRWSSVVVEPEESVERSGAADGSDAPFAAEGGAAAAAGGDAHLDTLAVSDQ